ncbi:hypothetical protein BDQ17DRAFT_1410743 [Cyathus striatus]|nr:hypothetical protein BDQ17DRAFT_1410743 [Cyathus striatus]
MKATFQRLATILLALTLVSAAPVPAPAEPLDGAAQLYCSKLSGNFKDPACPEYNAFAGANKSPQKRQSSSVVPDVSGFPQPLSPIEGTVGSLIPGSTPSKGGQDFPNPVGVLTGVLSGSSAPSQGAPAAATHKRQLSAIPVLGGILSGSNINTPPPTKRQGLAGVLGSLGGSLGGSPIALPGTTPPTPQKRQGLPEPSLGDGLGGLLNFGSPPPPPAPPRRQLSPDILGSLGAVGGLLNPSSNTPPPPQVRQVGNSLPDPNAITGGVLGSLTGLSSSLGNAGPAPPKRQVNSPTGLTDILGGLSSLGGSGNAGSPLTGI